MSTVKGTLDQSLEQARTSVRHAAGDQGYALDDGESGPSRLVFTKGSSAFSWGSRMAVDLEASSSSSTGLTVTSREKWVLNDWGRGGRAARKLLDAVGAEH